MKIKELLEHTGNRGIKRNLIITLDNGKEFNIISARHPHGDSTIVGFSGIDYGEIRVQTRQIVEIKDQL